MHEAIPCVVSARLEFFFIDKPHTDICPICHALHTQKGCVAIENQNLHRLLDVPPMGSPFDHLHC